MGIGFATWGLAVTGWMVLAGIVLYSVGGSLQSGADEAMMYDYLKAQGRENVWLRISANATIIARLSYVVSIFIGGLAFVFYDRLPFLMRATTFFLMVIPLVQLAVVDKFQDVPSGEAKTVHYLRDLKEGIKELFHPQVSWLIPLYLMVQGVSYTVFTAGILRPLLYEKSGLNVVYHSFAISISLILTVLTMLVIRRFAAKRIGTSVIFLITTICAIGFAANIDNLPMVLPLIGLTVLQVGAYSLMPLLSTALNSNISSRYRATTLSAASFMQSIVYVIVAPIVGFLSYKGLINEVAIGATLTVIVGIFLSLMLKYFSTKVSTS